MSAARTGHVRLRRDGWSLWVDPSAWRDAWWAALRRALDGEDEAVAVSRHARTSVVELAGDGCAVRAFAKVFRPADWRGEFKDLWRSSKAIRALDVSAALTGDGFTVPRVLAAGEQRRVRRLHRAFLLTAGVAWPALWRLADDAARRPPADGRALRRTIAARLGDEVGRLHRLGWVHGDLLATNILVDASATARFCFLDNDRTRRVSSPRREPLQRRNLVQLNRLPLAGVSNSDRLRFFARYAAARGWLAERRRAEARRLAEATRRRRIEIERLAARKTSAVV